MPKTDKRQQWLTPLTIDQEQRRPPEHTTLGNDRITTDEHRQIASYSNQLAHLTDRKPIHSIEKQAHFPQERAEKKFMIAKLEAENK